MAEGGPERRIKDINAKKRKKTLETNQKVDGGHAVNCNDRGGKPTTSKEKTRHDGV